MIPVPSEPAPVPVGAPSRASASSGSRRAMRITAVRTVVVWGPRRPAYGSASRTALGLAAVSEHAIVFVDTDAGITGLGEVVSPCSSGAGDSWRGTSTPRSVPR